MSSPGSADPVDRVATLRSSYLFEGLSDRELDDLAARTLVRRYRRGDAVYRVGEPATALFVVASGQLKEELVTADGDEHIFEVYSAGGVAGEPGLFAIERDRVVDLLAMTDACVLEIPREPLVAYLVRHPHTMLRLLQGLSSYARMAVEDEANLGHQRVRERVAYKLVELASTHGQTNPDGVRIQLQLSQGTLSSLIASQRENVNRALSAMARDGLVRMTPNEVVILDLDQLRAEAATGRITHRRNRRRTPPGGGAASLEQADRPSGGR